LSLITRLYIGIVIALGTIALGHGLFLWDPGDVLRFLCYLVLAVPASCLKVTLPGITGTMSVLFIFVLAAIVELGLPKTLLLGTLCVAVQYFWHARLKPRPIQFLFSVANVALAITATQYAYSSIPSLAVPFRLAIAASVYFLTNTVPIAIVVALTENKSFRKVWSTYYCWYFPYYLVGAAIVSLLSLPNRRLDWRAGILILPVVYVIYRSYRLYLDQLQTERTRAEEARKHANEIAELHVQSTEALASAIRANAKLDAVIRASPLAIIGLNREGNVTSWNQMAEQMFGWSQEEVVGRFLPTVTGPSEEIIYSILSQTLRGESIAGTELKQWRKDGSPFEATVWTAPLRDKNASDAAVINIDDNAISGILVTVADVSGHKRLEEQLRLSQKMEAVGRLAGGIAHDFNNILTVINGYSSLLIDTARTEPNVVRQAEHILGAGNRASDLVSQLLSFSRRQMIKPKAFEVNGFVHDVERMLQRIIGEHIEFRTELDPDTGWIHADLNQMEGVLLNLATNARDAMPDGGVLTIETRRAEINADAAHQDLAAGSYACLIIKDTGHGMDSVTLQRLFEPFFTTKAQGKGTGLGLSSVYGGVEQNGGRIFVSSELEKGTQFSIYLPLVEPPESQELRPLALHGQEQGSGTILLVEDENTVRTMLHHVLAKAGYRVWDAANGAEAIMHWGGRIEEIDLVITDIVMPVMNGLRLAEELRNRRPGLKIVYMSGHSEDVINRQTGLDPAPDLLQKPFLPDALLRKVIEVLSERSIKSARASQSA
jgi:two-component system, cell cycle sensor histidine kinase and response regulator CckA